MLKKISLLLMGLCFTKVLSATELTQVSAEQLLAKQANKADILLLDVRSQGEFADGHIKGTININFTDISANIRTLAPYQNKEIIVYCRSGRRAEVAIDELASLGFTQLSHLSGDILGWNADSRPLVK